MKTQDTYNLTNANISQIHVILELVLNGLDRFKQEEIYAYIPLNHITSKGFALADVEFAINFLNMNFGAKVELLNRQWLNETDPLAHLNGANPYDNHFVKMANEFLVIQPDEDAGISTLKHLILEAMQSTREASENSNVSIPSLLEIYKLSPKKRKLIQLTMNSFVAAYELEKKIPTTNLYKLVSETNKCIAPSGYKISNSSETLHRKSSYKLIDLSSSKTRK